MPLGMRHQQAGPFGGRGVAGQVGDRAARRPIVVGHEVRGALAVEIDGAGGAMALAQGLAGRPGGALEDVDIVGVGSVMPGLLAAGERRVCC